MAFYIMFLLILFNKNCACVKQIEKILKLEQLQLTPRQGHEFDQLFYLHEWAVQLSGGWPTALNLARRHGFRVNREVSCVFSN